MTEEDYKALLPTLPKEPGVYQFIGAEEIILYVGKAKNLKNRVSSYFTNKRHQRFRTQSLVKNAIYIKWTIVNTEQDALLLENTLIKKHQPKYNVRLKDGKSYPYLCITNERFPRVFFTRKKYPKGGTYFGPYTSKPKIDIILDLIKKLFKLRTCKYNLSEENIKAEKFKVCLEYHIKNCEGPCVGLEDEASYNDKIEQVKNILKGSFGNVKSHLHAQLKEAVEELAFEKAQEIKNRLDAFDEYQNKSTVVSPTIGDVDVFSIVDEEAKAYVNFLRIVSGAVIYSYSFELDKNLDDELTDLLVFSIYEMWAKYHSPAREILVPFDLPIIDDGVAITVPLRGDKKHLLDLSLKNANFFRLKRKKETATYRKKETTTERLLRTMQSDLNLPALPTHIECFDNSNLYGNFPTSSMVLFRNAKPANREYRHYNIKTVEGPDDYASMEEVVYRRYSRLLKEGRSLPQLIVIDGGKGQLSSAVKSLTALGIIEQVTVIGIAKRLEELYYPNDSVPLLLSKKSETLKVIQQLRNEAHRFAITFHRNQRSKNFTSTQLTDIPGVGEKSSLKLLQHFKSVERLRKAPIVEIEEIVGKNIAKKVIDHLDILH